jgi:DNA-binding transcriptional MerR regulator
MNKKSKMENKKKETVFTSGQASGFTQVGLQSLRNYVNEFPEFFSPGVKQHKQGRRWTPGDIEMVQAIRCLKHERAGTKKIRDLIAGGWRLQDNQAWTKELISKLIESVLARELMGKELESQVASLERIIERSKRDDEEFKKLWIAVMDMQEEWKLTQKAIGVRTPIVKAMRFKKRYHGKLPDLYPERD